mgnify:CR=1 FL=1
MRSMALEWECVGKVAISSFFFFQAEDGIRDAQESRGLGDVYKRQAYFAEFKTGVTNAYIVGLANWELFDGVPPVVPAGCLLYTSDAADDLPCVDLGGRRIIKKKK